MRSINSNIMIKRAQADDEPDLVVDDDTPNPNLVEGLSRLLCGIFTYPNTHIVAAQSVVFRSDIGLSLYVISYVLKCIIITDERLY